MSNEWLDDPSTLPAARPRIAWRDSSRATDSRTIRCALIPPQTVLVHQAYYLFFRRGEEWQQAFVLGVMASIPFDWFARRFVESHATVGFMNSSPVPEPSKSSGVASRVVQIAGRLAAVDERFSEWAEALGMQSGKVPNEEREGMLAELDAAVALLYGLDESDVAHIFETFHVGWDYGPRLEAVLAHYDETEKGSHEARVPHQPGWRDRR